MFIWFVKESDLVTLKSKIFRSKNQLINQKKDKMAWEAYQSFLCFNVLLEKSCMPLGAIWPIKGVFSNTAHVGSSIDLLGQWNRTDMVSCATFWQSSLSPSTKRMTCSYRKIKIQKVHLPAWNWNETDISRADPQLPRDTNKNYTVVSHWNLSGVYYCFITWSRSIISHKKTPIFNRRHYWPRLGEKKKRKH